MEDKKEEIWCPSIHGSYTAYFPEYWDVTEWKRVMVNRWEKSNRGVPPPMEHGKINDTIKLCGHAQAWTLAYYLQAEMNSRGIDVKIRVQCYEVHYDIKARKLPEGG